MADEKYEGTMVKLTSSNYDIWKMLMTDVLYCKDLYDPIEYKGVKPEGISDPNWKKMERKACGMIRQWIDISVIHHVAQET